jgi:predicted aspartyl protease
MPAYDVIHFNPAAPLARVTLRNPSTGVAVSDVVLLVDCGADFTLLPRQAVEALGVSLATGQGYEVAGRFASRRGVNRVIKCRAERVRWPQPTMPR